MPNIPPKANRIWKNCFSPYLYRDRNAIEWMFCRLKDFRRVATRYDRLAVNFFAAVHIVATVAYWLGVRGLAEQAFGSAEFKARVAMEVIRGEAPVAQLTVKCGILQTMISAGKKQARPLRPFRLPTKPSPMARFFDSLGHVEEARPRADCDRDGDARPAGPEGSPASQDRCGDRLLVHP